MNQPFDQAVINLRERAVGSDLNVLGSQILAAMLEAPLRTYAGRTGTLDALSVAPSGGFISDGFMCVPDTLGEAVVVKAGLGYASALGDVDLALGDIPGVADTSTMKPLSLTADQFISPPPSGDKMTRVDRIEARYWRRLDDLLLTRTVIDPATGQFSSELVPKTVAWNLNSTARVAPLGTPSVAPISLRVGKPVSAAPGLPPPVPPDPTDGYQTLGLVTVVGGEPITPSSIADLRRLLLFSNQGSVGLSFDISTTIRTAPTLTAVMAQPGLQLAVLAGSAFATGAFSVYIFSPLTNASAGGVVGDGSAGALVQAPVPGVVDAALQTLLRNYATGSIPGVGQPFLQLDGQAVPIGGGSLGTSINFRVSVSCQW